MKLEFTEAAHTLVEELVLTGLLLMETDLVPGLVRCFAWIEARRLKRQWKLFEWGLLVVSGHVRRLHPGNPLADQLLDYVEQRHPALAKWAKEPPPPLPPPWDLTKMTAAERARWDRQVARNQRLNARDVKQKTRLLQRSFARGDQLRLMPVISFRLKGGGTMTTVWGFESASGQWPTPADVQRRRREVWDAHERSARKAQAAKRATQKGTARR